MDNLEKVIPSLPFELCPICHQWHRMVLMVWCGRIVLERSKENICENAPQTLTTLALRSNLELQVPPNYARILAASRTRLPPELIQSMIPWICERDSIYYGDGRQLIQRALLACCLVSREWNMIFTPVLYEEIFLGHKNPLLTQSLLHRTLRYTQPAHKALVKTMMMKPKEDGSSSSILSICFSSPHLRKLILSLNEFDLSALHPNFVQQLRSLSKRCIVQIVEDDEDYVDVDWASLPRYIDFTRRSKSTSRKFWTTPSGGKWHILLTN